MRFTLLSLGPGVALIVSGYPVFAAGAEQTGGWMLAIGVLWVMGALRMLGPYWRARIRSRAGIDARASARRRAS